MKTTKLVMITALISFALMSFANAELGMSKNVISLKAAMSNPSLVSAIYSQVDPLTILNIEKAGTFTVQVVLKKSVYLISGTYKEWSLFFRDVDNLNLLCKDNTKPVSSVDKNPFGNAGYRISPFSKSNPFGKKGKKQPSKKGITVIMNTY